MANENQNFKKNIVTYFKGVKAEWSKVSWPTRKQVGVETVIVLVVGVVLNIKFCCQKHHPRLLNIQDGSLE